MEAVCVRASGSMAAILGGKVAHSVGIMDPKPLKFSAGALSFPLAKVLSCGDDLHSDGPRVRSTTPAAPVVMVPRVQTLRSRCAPPLPPANISRVDISQNSR